jgi:hypothetical protein
MTLNYKAIINYITKIWQMLLKKQKERIIIIERFWILKNIWSIIKSAAVRKVKNEDTHLLNIDGHITNNCQVISDAFGNYFIVNCWKNLVSPRETRCYLPLSARYMLTDMHFL